MPSPVLKTSPAVKRKLRMLGTRLKTARQLRRLPMELIAARAGTTRATLHRIERGDSNVRIGTYLLVLQALGLLDEFGDVKDKRGEELLIEQLPKRVRGRARH